MRCLRIVREGALYVLASADRMMLPYSLSFRPVRLLAHGLVFLALWASWGERVFLLSASRCRSGLYGEPLHLREGSAPPCLAHPPFPALLLCGCFGETSLFPAISMGETLGLLGKLLRRTILHQKIDIMSSLFVRRGEDCVISIGKCGGKY